MLSRTCFSSIVFFGSELVRLISSRGFVDFLSTIGLVKSIFNIVFGLISTSFLLFIEITEIIPINNITKIAIDSIMP